MNLATCVHFINKNLNSVLMADQQFKIVATKGYGGVFKDGEDGLKCAAREIPEETGKDKSKRLNPDEESEGIIFDTKDLIPVAVIDFYNGTEEEVPFGDPSYRVIFYNCYVFSGYAIDTLEMRNPWFYLINDLPFHKMVPGDELFIQDILEGKMRTGWIRRTNNLLTVIDPHIEACELKDLVI
jgi:hypothetical protein